MPSTPAQQFQTFKMLLREKRGLKVESPVFGAIVNWLKLPLEMPPEYSTEIKELTCLAFDIDEIQLRSALLTATKVPDVQSNGHKAAVAEPIIVRPRYDATRQAKLDEIELEGLLPPNGFIADYARYTRNSEAPLAYHVFCAITGIAAIVNRRIHFDMGNFKLFLPFGVLILGPSGIKKTSAADIIVGLLNEMQLTPVYAEKLTPEALVDAMRGGNATGLVYAPEMTVLINKQRYMESIIPLLTRFMDSPDIWKSETVMRGKSALTDVAITCLMCSTLDWFIENTPDTLFGGGFIARNIMVLQEASARIIPLPEPSDQHLRTRLTIQLAEMHELQGQVTLDPEVTKLHYAWYEEDKRSRIIEHELLETYYQRKPQHMLRIAIALHVSTCHNLILCPDCWHRAAKLLAWTERFLPGLARKMFKSSWGKDQELILAKLRNSGGSISHSELVRRMQYRMGAMATRNIISSLKEAGVVTETRSTLEHTYSLNEEHNDSHS